MSIRFLLILKSARSGIRSQIGCLIWIAQYLRHNAGD